MIIDQILLYHGRPMARHPIGKRIEAVASDLRNGHAVGVELQPGDGTVYYLLLAPAWNPNHRDAAPHVGDDRRSSTLIVGYHSYGMAPLSDRADWGYVAEKLNCNEWTARLLAWWLAELWAEIEEA
jgi:hypothetical protein